MVNHVCEFIKTLPTTTSHHSRAKYPNRRFVPPGMSQRFIYVSYLDWVPTAYPQDVDKVTFSKFRDIYTTGFNITQRFDFLIYLIMQIFKINGDTDSDIILVINIIMLLEV